jgi:hypothetical protein
MISTFAIGYRMKEWSLMMFFESFNRARRADAA